MSDARFNFSGLCVFNYGLIDVENIFVVLNLRDVFVTSNQTHPGD